jgi:hypothetical protein
LRGRAASRNAGYRPGLADLRRKSELPADSFVAWLSDEDFREKVGAHRMPGNTIDRNAAVTEEIDLFLFLRQG